MSIQHLPKPEGDYIDLKIIFKTVFEKKGILLLVSLLTFFGTMIYSINQPARYQASVLLQDQHKPNGSLGSFGNAYQYGQNLLEEPVAVQIALIRSQYVLADVIHSLGLDMKISKYPHWPWEKESEPNKNIVISYLNLPSAYLNMKLYITAQDNHHFTLSDKDNNLLLEGPVGHDISTSDMKIFLSKLDATPGQRFEVIKSPLADIIKDLQSNLVISDLSGSSENAHTGIIQISLVGTNPDKVMQILNKTAMITQEKDKERKAQDAIKTLSFLMEQLPLNKYLLTNAENKLNNYRATSGNIDMKLQTQYLLNELADINKQLEATELKRIDMLQEFTINHPFVTALTQKRTALIKQRLFILDHIKRLPTEDQKGTELLRDVQVKNHLYLTLLNKIHEQRAITAGMISDLKMLSFATYTDKLRPIKLPIIAISSLLVGFMLGILGILASQIIRPRINDPHWTERSFAIENLIVLPHSSEKNYNGTGLLAYHHPENKAIESLHFLKRILQKKSFSGKNIISIMSLSSGVGKTFLSANLAGILAKTGHKVLLIDGDFRQSHMGLYIKASHSLGLTDILAKNLSPEKVIVNSGYFDSLDFLPVGQALLNSHEFSETSIQNRLSSLAKQYDYLIINTSALSHSNDSLFLSALSEINLLMIGAKKHHASEISNAIKKLHSAGIPIHGTIFNDCRNKPQFKKSLSYYLFRYLQPSV